MLSAIESFVRLFEHLLVTRSPRPAEHYGHADNDNAEMEEEERRWAAYR